MQVGACAQIRELVGLCFAQSRLNDDLRRIRIPCRWREADQASAAGAALGSLHVSNHAIDRLLARRAKNQGFPSTS